MYGRVRTRSAWEKETRSTCFRIRNSSQTWKENLVLLHITFHKTRKHTLQLRGLMVMCLCAPLLSLVQLFVTLWTVGCQAPLSKAFFRKEYWSGLPFPSPVDLPDPGIKPMPLALAGRFFTTGPHRKPCNDLRTSEKLLWINWEKKSND